VQITDCGVYSRLPISAAPGESALLLGRQTSVGRIKDAPATKLIDIVCGLSEGRKAEKSAARAAVERIITSFPCAAEGVRCAAVMY
jgi:hypothetical protein